jgi:hypothetical protein
MEDKPKYEIPKYDPYTGELNPYYEEQTSEITAENWDKYSPYCPVCNACGEVGCCSAMSCKQDPNGHYCETYLKELKFGYIMYHELLKMVDGDEKYKEHVDKLWDEKYDLIFDKK